MTTSQFTLSERNGLVYKPHPRFLAQNLSKKVRLIQESLRYLFFFKKRLLLLKKHFETGMLLLPKNIFLLCDSTVHPVNIHIIRPNDRKAHARCKSGRSGQGGVGTRHRKCFFHGRDQSIENITLNCTVLLTGNYSIK